MFISQKKYLSLERRIEALEWSQKVYGSDSSYQVGQVVQMILAHLKLHIHNSPPRTELRSKGGPEQS